MQLQKHTDIHRSTDIVANRAYIRTLNRTNVPTTTSSTASIGERIAQLRKRLNLSQSALASAANISREAIGKYERGESSPSVDIAGRIAEALDVTLDFLVAGSNSSTDDLDGDILSRARELAALPENERTPVLAVLDAYLRDVRIRQAYSA